MPKAFSDQERNEVTGLRVKAQRQAVGLSQDALAAAIGLTQQQVANYENGKTLLSDALLLQIAEQLKCTVEQLAGVGEWASLPLHLPAYARAIYEIETFGIHDKEFLIDMLFKHIKELRELNAEKAARGLL